LQTIEQLIKDSISLIIKIGIDSTDNLIKIMEQFKLIFISLSENHLQLFKFTERILIKAISDLD
jgi:hypothetical protein